ncbi:hypothetical protein SRHO_G00137970 [Serrasalmus rhombeus]
MIRNFIIIIQSLYWIKGVARADDVIQPNTIWAQIGQSAMINCEHTKDATYTHMYCLNMSNLMVRFILIAFIHYIIWIAVSAANNEVSQIPAELFRKSGESADLQCSHSISGYNTILWYKQARNGELQFMGYLTVTSPQPEPEFSKKVKFSGRGNTNGTLTINALTSNDSAVYFCAASTQWLMHPLTSTKTLLF